MQVSKITAVCLAVLWWHGAAGAQTPIDRTQLDDTLTLDPGASCLEPDRLVGRIVRWREGADVDATLRVRVRGDAHDPTRIFFSVVRVGSEPTERTLDNAPTDCDQLHSAVALSIALAIDALLSNERKLPLPAAVPETKDEDQPRLTRPPPLASGPGFYIELALLAGASVSVLPNTAWVAASRLQLSPLPWLAFAIAGMFTAADELALSGVPGRFDAALLALGLDACAGGETTARFSFFACAGARGGSFATSGYGFERVARSNRRWWGIVASGQARAWVLPTVGIGISVEASFALADRDLVATSATGGGPVQVRTLSRFGLSISGGPVFRFF